MTYLSDEQMSVALFGIPKDAQPSWTPVALPQGRQQLPPWAKGLHVDLMLQYGNSPHFKLKCDRSLRDWEHKAFAKEGDRYMAVSEDGRAEVYYQGGGLTMTKLRRFRTEDGHLWQARPNRPGASNIIRTPEDWENLLAPGEWVEVNRLATRQERGFAGAHIDIVLDDGREVTLRGPWHGPCPPGFVEAGYVDTSDQREGNWWRGRPWYRRGGIGGLFLAEAAFLPVFATYAPHMHLAHVDMGRGPRLEAYLDEWGEPKAWMQARERYARKLADFQAMPEAERPPHTLCNFPKVCGGKQHCAVAECNHCTRKAA